MNRIAIATLVVLPLTGSGFAQPHPPPADVTALEKVVAEELAQTQTPGAALIVVKDGAVAYARGFGQASLEAPTPVTTATLFRLGSTTKMMTAAAVLSLVADGKLALTQPVTRYVPSLGEPFTHVTLQQLLSHSAGLCESAPSIESKDDDALAKEIAGWTGTQRFYTAPGAMFSYAGPSYYLSGRILELAAGKPYADAMAQLVFEPLAMQSSTLRPLLALTRPLAQGHVRDKGGVQVVRPMVENVAMYPGGSVFSSADDLGRFMLGMLSGAPLGKPRVASEFFQRRFALPTPPHERGAYFYGFGTVAYSLADVPVFEHGGVRRGYGSFIRIIPAKKVGIAVLTNLNGVSLRRSVAKATSVFAGLTEKRDEPPPPIAPDAKELTAISGEYKQCGLTWKYSGQGGKLLREAAGEKTEMTRRAPYYYASEDGQDALFLLDTHGVVEYVHSDLVSAKKAPDPGPRGN